MALFPFELPGAPVRPVLFPVLLPGKPDIVTHSNEGEAGCFTAAWTCGSDLVLHPFRSEGGSGREGGREVGAEGLDRSNVFFFIKSHAMPMGSLS